MKLQKIVNKVNEHFDCDITVNIRQREIVMARGAYFYLARKTTTKSLKDIGAAVGRDHSSVLYSLSNFDDWIMFDKNFNEKFKILKSKIFKNFRQCNMTPEKLLHEYNRLIIENDMLKNQIKNYKNELSEKH